MMDENDYSSLPLRISIMLHAALVIELPGPKIAATPAL